MSLVIEKSGEGYQGTFKNLKKETEWSFPVTVEGKKVSLRFGKKNRFFDLTESDSEYELSFAFKGTYNDRPRNNSLVLTKSK